MKAKNIILMSIFFVLGCTEKYMPPYNPTSPPELCRLLLWTAKKGICMIASMHQKNPGVWGNATTCFNTSSPLHEAVKEGCNPSVRLLLALGADINARDSLGRTPLHFAVNTSAHSSIVFALVHAGARVNVQDANGDTPLHVAVHTDLRTLAWTGDSGELNPKLLNTNTLLVAGANRSIENNMGDTPVSIAMNGSEKLTMFLLEEKVLRMRFPVEFCEEVWTFPKTCPSNDLGSELDIFGRNKLIRHVILSYNDTLFDEDMEGCDVNARDIFNRTALHEACRLGKSETVKILLEKKARVNLRDWLGQTPLHLASMCLREEVKSALQNSRANQNAPDRKGRTPDEITKFVT